MLTQLMIWLNHIANLIGSVLLAPVQWLPGWLSATMIGMVSGVLMLVVFKYTSNQTAVRKTRSQIKANMLALSLFKDNLRVSLLSQSRLFAGAIRLAAHSVIPITVMAIPVTLMLGQISLWYQARPMHVGEDTIVTVQLRNDAKSSLDSIALRENSAIEILAGPVRVPQKNMACWNVRVSENGDQQLQFDIDGQLFTKDLTAGNGFAPTSLKRPSRKLTDVIRHPRELPFTSDSVVQSIEVAYPGRDSITTGSDRWIVYWFVVSMIAAFAVKPLLNVSI